MALTHIDPQAALVVIDMQKGVVALPTVHPASEITRRIAELAQAFRAQGLPVILVNVAGRALGRTDTRLNFTPPADCTELVPELRPQAGDYTVTKLQPGAFCGTALEQILRRCGVTQIFLAGIATSIGVESTARAAFDLGYHIVTIKDAMTDLDAAAHQHSIEKIFPRLSEVTECTDVLAQLSQRA